MKIAVPLLQGCLSSHFGQCDEFAILEADEQTRLILSKEYFPPPPHEPGALPNWLNELGADVIIAGGMGRRALQLFERHGIKVVTGAGGHDPEQLVAAWLEGALQSGGNFCSH